MASRFYIIFAAALEARCQGKCIAAAPFVSMMADWTGNLIVVLHFVRSAKKQGLHENTFMVHSFQYGC